MGPPTVSRSLRKLALLLVCCLAFGGAFAAESDDQLLLARLDELLAAGRPQAVVEAAHAMLAEDRVEARNVWRLRQRLAVALLDLDQPAAAVPELEAALAVAPADPALHLNLGRALWRLGRRGHAVAEYEAALDLAPDEYLWRLEYAEALLGLAIHRDALREIRRARAACADCPAALRAEVNVHVARGDVGGGREALELLYAGQRQPEVRRLLAAALWAADQPVAVAALLDTVATAALTGAEVMILIQADRRLQRAARARAWLAGDQPQLADGWQPSHEFWAIAAEICLAGGHHEDALRAIDRAVASSPSTAVYHHNRAAVLSQLGRTREAEEALARAKRLAPELGTAP